MDDQRTFKSGGYRESDKGKPCFEGIPPHAMRRVAKRTAFGRDKYKSARGFGEGKWLPTSVCLDSLERHLNAYRCGDNSEDHLAAVVTNALMLMETEECAPEYHDIPERKGLPCNEYRTYSSSRKRRTNR
jgi:hypothetical protein